MTDLKRWWWLGIFIILGICFYALSPILSPFLIGATFAYLGDPLVDWFEKKKLPRLVGVLAVFIVFTLIATLFILMMVPMLGSQIEIAIEGLPRLIQYAEVNWLPWINQQLGEGAALTDLNSFESILKKQFMSDQSAFSEIFSKITASSLALFAWFANLVLIPVVTFYLLRDWDIMVEKIMRLLPRKVEPVIQQLTHECDEVLSAFVRGQLMVMIALGAIYAIGLQIVGLNLALLVGMIAGLASIVPYLGFFIGIIFAVLAALVQFGDPSILIWVALVFGIGQLLEGMVLTPILVGDKIGLHPVAVIFAIMAGGQLFGFVGILIALPVAAVIMVLLRHAHDKYVNSVLYGKDDELETCAENQQECVEAQSLQMQSEQSTETVNANADLTQGLAPK